MLLQSVVLFKKRYSFSSYENFSEKLTFFTPDTRTYLCVSGGKK